MDDDELTPEERAEIERVSDTLADPAVWAVPSPELQERVVAAIAEAEALTRREAHGEGSGTPSWGWPPR